MKGRILILYFVSDEVLIKNSFYTPIIDGIRMQAKDAEYELFYLSLRDLDGQELGLALRKAAEKVNGFIFLGMRPKYVGALNPILNQLDMPTVIVTTEYRTDYAKADHITPDNVAAVKEAISFLVGHNHRRIAFFKHRRTDLGFSNNVVAGDLRDRLRGYQEGLAMYGIPYDDSLVVELQYNSESKVRTDAFGSMFVSNIEMNDIKPVFALLTRPAKPTAVFCANDISAFYLLKMAEQTQLKIPEQLTVVGFDGIRETGEMKPPLTTVQTPLEEMGERAVARVIERILKDNRMQGRDILLPSVIVGRASHRTLESS